MEAVNWLTRLRTVHGTDRVVDVIAQCGPALQTAAEELKFGMYVVRQAVTDPVLGGIE